MEFNSDFRFDLEFGKLDGESWFHKLVSDKKIEVKSDRKTEETGNIYIEYESRGKESGIKTTQADYWVYKVSSQKAIIIGVQELKDKLNELVQNGKAKMNIKGGDNNSSLGCLIKLKDIL